MAKTQIKATAQLFLDVSNAKSDAKKFVADLKEQLSSVETAADKMKVFKNLVNYISQADAALSALRSKHGDTFNDIFDGMDKDFVKDFESLFGLTGKEFGKLGALSEQLESLDIKDGVGKIRKAAEAVNNLFVAAGKEAPLNIDEFKNKATLEQIEKIKVAFKDFGVVFTDVAEKVKQGFNFGGGNGIDGPSNQLQNEIDKLKQQKKEYQEIVDAINKSPIKIETTSANDAKELQKLLDAYKTITEKVLSQDFGSKSFEEQTKMIAERVRLATLLTNTANDILEKDSSSGDAVDLAQSMDIRHASTFLDDFHIKQQKKAQEIKTVFVKMVSDINVELNKMQSPYDKLNDLLQEYYDLKKKIASVDKGSNEYKNLRIRQQLITSEIASMKDLTDDETDAIYDVFESINNGSDMHLPKALQELCDMLQIEIPNGAQSASNAVTSGFAKITQEAQNASNATQKLMYHVGNLLGGNGKAQDAFGKMPFNLTYAAEGTAYEKYGFGLLGGGLFGVSDPGLFDQKHIKGSKLIHGIDISKYNMYMADTEERATNLMDFFSKLQKFAMKSAEPNYTGFDEQLRGVNIDTMYDQFKVVFAEADFTKEQLNNFINEMIDLLRQAGLKFDAESDSLDFTSVGDLENTDNISTRLLKKLGYQGVNVGGTTFDGLGQGSVLFDFNESDIVSYFNTVGQAVDDFQKRLNNGSWDGTNEQLKQYRKNIDEIIERLQSNKLRYENVGTKAAQATLAQFEQTINRLLKVQLNIDDILAGKSTGDVGSFEQVTTATEQAGATAQETAKDLDVASKKYHEFITLAENFSEIEYTSEQDVKKNISRLTELRNELIELGNQGKITNEQLDLINNAFDKAETHLNAMDHDAYSGGGRYDYTYAGELYQEEQRNEELQIENESLRAQLEAQQAVTTEVEQTNQALREQLHTQEQINATASTEEANEKDATKETAQHQELLNIIEKIKVAVDQKTEAFKAEASTVDTVVTQEIESLKKLKESLESIQTLIQNIFNGQVFTVNGLEGVESHSGQSVMSVSLESIKTTLSSILGVLQGFTGLKSDNENSVKQAKPVDQTRAAETSLRKKATEYSDIQRFTRDNIKELISLGFKNSKLTKNLWRDANYAREDFKPVEITRDDAIDIIRDKVPGNILDGWFRESNVAYKPRLEQVALSDTSVRNAALNIMWDNYKEYSKKDIGFNEFLYSNIPVYRGKNEEKYDQDGEILSFSFDRSVAEKFGKHVLETVIRPIDTIGAYQTTGEAEVQVRNDQLEQLPEFNTWLNNMSSGLESSFVQAAKTISVDVDKQAGQDKINDGGIVGILQAIAASLDSIYGVLSGSTGIKADTENSVKYKPVNPEHQTAVERVDSAAQDTTNAPWALETTLQTVNGVLGSILDAVQNDESLTKLSSQLTEAVNNLSNVVKNIGQQQQMQSGNVADNMEIASNSDEVQDAHEVESATERETQARRDNIDAMREETEAQERVNDAKQSAIEIIKSYLKERYPKLDDDALNKQSEAQISRLLNQTYVDDPSRGYTGKMYLHGSKDNANVLDPSYYLQEYEALDHVLQLIGYHLGELKPSMIDNSTQWGFSAEIVANSENVVTNMEEARRVLLNIGSNNSIEQQAAAEQKLANEAERVADAKKEQAESAERASKQDKKQSQPSEIFSSARTKAGSKYDLELAQLKSKINIPDSFADEIEDAGKAIKNAADTKALRIAQNEWGALINKIKEAATEQDLFIKKSKTGFGASIATNATARFNALSNRAQPYVDAGSSVVKTQLDETEKAYKRLIALREQLASQGSVSKEDEAQLRQLRDEYNNCAKALEKIINSSNELNTNGVNTELIMGDIDVNDINQRAAALRDYVQTQYGASASALQLNGDATKLEFTLKNTDGTVTKMAAAFDAARTSISSVRGATKEATSIFDLLKNKTKELFVYAASRFGVDEIIQAVRQGVTYVREIDTALTELKKVTDETDATYNKFLQDMSKTASVVGSTVSELTTMAAEWARLNI